MIISLSKTCTKCLRDLPFSSFHKHATAKFGLRPKCKECIHQQRIDYYQKNQELKKEYSRKYYAENAEKVKKYQRHYNSKPANKIKIKEAKQKRSFVQRENFLQKKKDYYLSNLDKLRETAKKRRKQNPIFNRIGAMSRRVKKYNCKGKVTAANLLAKCDYWGWRCYLCLTPLSFQTMHFDHRKSLKNGGSHWVANIAPACQNCNNAKGNKTEKEYRLSMQINNL